MIERAIFLGSKRFGLELFKSLYEADPKVQWAVTCPPDQDDARTCFNKFDEYARAKGLNLRRVNSTGNLARFAADYRPDVMIVCGYYRVLPKEMIDGIPAGVWGIHNSLLPRYRGGSPLVWQIINRESTVGSTFFKFADGVDNGPVLDQVRINNADGLDIKEASDLIESEWIKRAPDLWRNFCDGKLIATEQNHLDATYCAQRNEFDGAICWHWHVDAVDAFIRAQASPYPRAFFRLDRQNVKIVKHRIDGRVVYGTPGQVFEVRDNYVSVCCGNNSAIHLIELEVDGEIQEARNLLPSIKIRLQ